MRISNQLGIPPEKEAQFVVDLWKYGCGPFMKQKYEEYAKKYNCDQNIQELELEKIADTTILMAKKHYAMAEIWKEPDIFLRPMEEVVYKGLDIVKGPTPPYARECQKDFTNFVLEWYQHHKERMPYDMIIEKLKGYKQKYTMCAPDEISTGGTIGNYDKFVIDDKNKLTFGGHCPKHVQAAGIANYLLNQPKNKKYKVRYSKIRTADKVKWYYAKDPNYDCFAYLPGFYPIEYAPPIDYDTQFEKTILSPCNKIIEILNYKTLTADLCYTAALW